MTTARIFTPDPPTSRHPWLLALIFAAVIAAACALESGAGDALLALFGLPGLAFGYLVGRWWAVTVPVLLATAAFTVGFECSPSEAPQGLLLAGCALGVLTRVAGERILRGPR